MRWRRFFPWLALSFILSMCLACAQIAAQVAGQTESARQTESADPTESIAPPIVNSPSISLSSPPPLPPQTEAIVAQAGNLYNPPRGEVRLAVISDLNSAYGSTDYEPEVDRGIQLMPFWQPDLVLCGGDMVAGQNSSLTAAQIRAMWAAFDQHVTAPLRQLGIPFGFTIGNHDASGARSGGGFLFQRERDLAREYWQASAHDPGVQFIDRQDFPFYYTFKYQDVFFLVWDGSSSSIPSDRLNWVKQTLASPEAQQAKLKILLGHLPLYGVAVGRDQPGEVMDDADALRTLLEQYDVHTYISGHHHAYYPAHKGKMQLLHTGILGAGPRSLIAGDAAPRKTLTIIDINFTSPELTTYTTYDMTTFQLIQLESLPRYLTGHNGTVLRRDVENLNAAEQKMCEQKLGNALCAA